ncbi:MAG: hypothetical protein IPP72_00595 [Chitinophagaceae bacterium]|nr:hypothetical protein [Chitinophagaceae bacterium]
MKKIILTAIFYFTAISIFSQKINGQWRGYFDSKGDIVQSNYDNTEYVLELEINGTVVTGFSYSYFQGRKYYVICNLKGTYYPNSKSIKVIEMGKVKGNTPPDFQDCFQIHYLTYEKEGKLEKLVGRWVTAPGQTSSCGDGTTTLTRRTLDKSLSKFNKQSTRQPLAKKATPKTNKTIAKSSLKPVTPKTKTAKVPVKPKANHAPVIVKAEPAKKEPQKVELPEIKKSEVNDIRTDINFEKRKADVLKTIQIESETFKVDLYDNGEVDGDSISLFYNSRLILSHKRLSEKPITLTLDVTTSTAVNELTMYAENLGEIPPNTALMVITDGEKRYEVRISSDLKNSGTIRFIHKGKTPQ